MATAETAPTTIHVNAELRDPHPLVAQVRKDLQKRKPDRDGFLFADLLNIEVSPATLDRALRIMDAILKAAGEAGFKMVPSGDGRAGTELEVLGEKLTFGIRERKLQTKHVPVSGESWPKFDYRPSGDLSLSIRHKWGWRTTLTDRKRKPLEQVLDRFISELSEGAKWVAKVHENERQGSLRAHQEAQHRWEEESRIKDLNQQVSNWHESRRIREYLAALKDAVIQKWGAIESGGPVERWLAWAHRYADHLDPLKDPNANEAEG